MTAPLPTGPTASRFTIPRRLLAVLAATATAGFLWAAAMLVAILRDEHPPVPTPVAISVTVVLVLPSFAAAIVANHRSPERATLRRIGSVRLTAYYRLYLSNLPGRVIAAAVIAFLAFWLVGMVGLGSLSDGGPEIQDGRYVLNNHGAITVIDKAAYERAQAAEELLWESAFGSFGVGAALLCLAAARRPAPTAGPLSSGSV